MAECVGRVISAEGIHADARQAAHMHRQSAAKLLGFFVERPVNLVAEVALNRPRMVLGRDDSCDISLDSRYVSRFQNLFMETPDGWVLIDLSSTNGCFVNGRRVREHRLRDGDLIAVGHHQMRFAGPSAKSASASGLLQPAEDESDTATLIGPKPMTLRTTVN